MLPGKIGEKQSDKYSKSRLSPSDFVKQELKLIKSKKYLFAKHYFSYADLLVKAIRAYKQKSAHREHTLADLLR